MLSRQGTYTPKKVPSLPCERLTLRITVRPSVTAVSDHVGLQPGRPPPDRARHVLGPFR
jgi:hypothetical protein